jgi:hypothetical protein
MLCCLSQSNTVSEVKTFLRVSKVILDPFLSRGSTYPTGSRLDKISGTILDLFDIQEREGGAGTYT